LEQAVSVVFEAVRNARPGETYIPRVPASRMIDVARALIEDRKIKIDETGIRPGEKLHEILISEEEAHRTHLRGDYYVILPILPELRLVQEAGPKLGCEFSSADNLMAFEEVQSLLRREKLLVGDLVPGGGELLR
jgi:FlaA1/EpsC-like NDP-sugar epimerase